MPPTSNADLDGLSMNGRVATYSCDSALYELEGSNSIIYDEKNGWPDAPTCKSNNIAGYMYIFGSNIPISIVAHQSMLIK